MECWSLTFPLYYSGAHKVSDWFQSFNGMPHFRLNFNWINFDTNKEANLNSPIIFAKSITQLIILLAYITTSNVFWILHSFLSKKKNLIGNLIFSLIILLETFNSGLLTMLVNSMDCEKLTNNSYLSKDLRVSCQTDEFHLWV